MLHLKPNLSIKIFGFIFAAINLALISGGLISCSNEVQKPLEQTEQQKEQYKNKSTEQSESEQDNDDDEKDNNSKDEKDDDDKN
ncbi:hypothetical protein HCG51_06625 [Tolypothrix sp. PCC 7910]|uniref:hypothetical protein n=1 Tax=Tolypothrix sp. PCC 7910 TaxID=2099387 RepID=UPI001427963C|nr:hypothetical protein [Tolypothrix sp. PCC 7910]QIR36459.1 hypothetical protein HCG51_06625 [Tolypothrix sp. PCC 7910]